MAKKKKNLNFGICTMHRWYYCNILEITIINALACIYYRMLIFGHCSFARSLQDYNKCIPRIELPHQKWKICKSVMVGCSRFISRNLMIKESLLEVRLPSLPISKGKYEGWTIYYISFSVFRPLKLSLMEIWVWKLESAWDREWNWWLKIYRSVLSLGWGSFTSSLSLKSFLIKKFLYVIGHTYENQCSRPI